MAKILYFFGKIIQKLTFFVVLVLYWSSKKIFSMLYWSWVDWWPQNYSCIGIGSKFFGNFFYCFGLGSTFLAKNFGYWCCIDLTKIQNAELCMPLLESTQLINNLSPSL